MFQLQAPMAQRSLQICFDFTKGMCTRGDKCKYTHDLATIVQFNSKEKGSRGEERTADARGVLEESAKEGFPESPARSGRSLCSQARPESSPSPMLALTHAHFFSGICFDYLRNQCSRGLLCRFSHDLSNIAQQCQVFNGTATKGRTNAICYDFVKGVCQRGSECRYSHDLSLIARTARGGTANTARGGEVCYDFLRCACWTAAASGQRIPCELTPPPSPHR